VRALVPVALIAVLAGCGLRDPYAAQSTRAGSASAARPAVTRSVEAEPRTGGGDKPLATARKFMRGYLPFLYGLGSAQAIVAITPALERELAAQPMARDDGASPSHPRLEALRLIARRGPRAVALAIVTDESGVYFPRKLALVQGTAGWQVTAISASGG
jgi:hypothetical protein